MVNKIRIKAVVSNISIIDNPWGEKMIKLDLTEERETPGTVMIQKGGRDDIAREIMPIVSQVLKSMPMFGTQGKVRVPRLTLYLTEDEWGKILNKPTIGEIIEIEINNEKITINSGK